MALLEPDGPPWALLFVAALSWRLLRGRDLPSRTALSKRRCTSGTDHTEGQSVLSSWVQAYRQKFGYSDFKVVWVEDSVPLFRLERPH